MGAVSELVLVGVAIGLGHLGGVSTFERLRLEGEGAAVGIAGALVCGLVVLAALAGADPVV